MLPQLYYSGNFYNLNPTIHRTALIHTKYCLKIVMFCCHCILLIGRALSERYTFVNQFYNKNCKKLFTFTPNIYSWKSEALYSK